jgi:orotidine 5'-phosphate decarboxylase subfamily 1
VKAERLRLCVALDVVDADTAKKVTRLLAEHVDVFKIGLQLFCAEGPSVIGAIRDAGAQEIFLDLKLHDIPNTVAGAVKSARRHAVDYLTVHTGGGRAMLEAAQSSRDHAQAKLDGIPYQVETEKVTRLRALLTQTEEEAAQLSGRLLEQVLSLLALLVQKYKY